MRPIVRVYCKRKNGVMLMTRLRSVLNLLMALMIMSAFSFVGVSQAVALDDDADMSFGEDDVEPIDEDDMTFAPTDVAPVTKKSGEKLTLAVVAIPSADLDAQDRIALQR